MTEMDFKDKKVIDQDVFPVILLDFIFEIEKKHTVPEVIKKIQKHCPSTSLEFLEEERLEAFFGRLSSFFGLRKAIILLLVEFKDIEESKLVGDCLHKYEEILRKPEFKFFSRVS